MIQVAVTNGDFIGTRPKLGATGNGDDFRRDSLEMRKATSQSMLAKVAGAGIRFYEVIGTYLKRRGKMRASCQRHRIVLQNRNQPQPLPAFRSRGSNRG